MLNLPVFLRRRRSARLAFGAVTLAWAALCGSCIQSSTTSARPDWHRLTLGLCEDYPEESRTLPAAQRDLSRVRNSGAKVLRIAFGWDAMEPEKGKYDWTFWDQFVPLATDTLGIELIPYVCYTPRWAARDQGPDYWRSPPRNPDDFAAFVTQLAKRYGKWVKSWELWNEPDNSAYWLGTPAEFAALTRAGSRAVRKADPGSRVVLGGLAGNLDFLEKLFRDEKLAPSVDVVNFHSYLETWHPDPIEEMPASIERASHIVTTFGEREPLWMAEVGYSSVGPRAKTSDSYHATYDNEHTLAAQANALLRFTLLAAASGQLERFAWYRVNDLRAAEDVIGDDNNRHLGLWTLEGAPKPAALVFTDLVQLFSEPYRIHPVLRVDAPPQTEVQVHVFEFTDGRRVLFAWNGMPRSRTDAAAPPVADTRETDVVVHLRRGSTNGVTEHTWITDAPSGAFRGADKAGEELEVRLRLRGSWVSAVEIAPR